MAAINPAQLDDLTARDSGWETTPLSHHKLDKDSTQVSSAMKKLLYLTSVLLVTLDLGCGRKTEVKAELEKAAEVLAKNDPEPAPQAQPAAPAPTIPDAMPAEQAAGPTVAPAQEMRQALAAYKDGKLEDAVTRLQKLRNIRTLTPQQRMAVQDSVAAVMNEVYELAAKGNMKAIQAVRQYEEMQTKPH